MTKKTKKTAKKKLTLKEKRFCQEYIVSSVGRTSAIHAGYSENSAGEIAYQLLRKPHIIEYIDLLTAERNERMQLSADRVLGELKRIAFLDVTKIVGYDPKKRLITIEGFNALTPDERACIKSMNMTKGGYIKLSFYDKLAALDKLGKNLKLFTDVTENKHSFNQMGRVMVGDQALSFEVGQEPDKE